MNEMEKKAGIRILRMLWLTLLGSILMYGVVVYVAAGQQPEQPFRKAFSHPLIITFHLVGALLFLFAFVVPSAILRRSTFASTPGAPPRIGVAPERIRVFLIMKWAMIESVAIVGLMAAFIAVDPRLFLPLAGLAVIGMLMTYPGDSVLQDMTTVP